jgi:hypothetical protein
MTSAFDPSDYVRAPIITAASGVALASALVDASPKTPAPMVAKALDRLKMTANKARDDLADRNRALGTFIDEDTRVLDNEADHDWGGLRLRLQGMALLDQAKYPKAKRAAELDATLFAGGMEFLKSDFPTQATTMSAIIERIDKDGLASDIDAIVGPEFLQAIRDVQPRYETMVSERLRRDKATGQNLLDTTRGLQAAIVNYASKIIGAMDEEDDASVESARVCLVPIANHRENVAGRRTVIDAPTPAAPTTPATTQPPVAPAPVKPA